jgi:hypothetical protein
VSLAPPAIRTEQQRKHHLKREALSTSSTSSLMIEQRAQGDGH